MTDIIHLQCPDCNQSLIGENNSRIFFCKTCLFCFDIDGSQIKKYSVECIKPEIKKNYSQVYFPFWKIEALLSDKKIFYIPAFFIKDTADFGDIGFVYMQNNVSLQSDQPRDIPIFPADRGFKQAAAYPRLYLQQEISKKKKKGTIEINITYKNISVVLIPFYYMDRGYFDSILLLKYPSGALI